MADTPDDFLSLADVPVLQPVGEAPIAAEPAVEAAVIAAPVEAPVAVEPVVEAPVAVEPVVEAPVVEVAPAPAPVVEVAPADELRQILKSVGVNAMSSEQLARLHELSAKL